MQNLDYRNMLFEEYSRRNRKNPRYTKRAFARDIGIDASQLSRIFNKKRNITYATAISMVDRIYNLKKDQKYFLKLVELNSVKQPEVKNTIIKQLAKIIPNNNAVNIKLEAMDFLSNWYHVALLDLTLVKDFKLKFPSYKEMAQFLGIKEIEARHTIERLKKVGLVKESNGTIVKSSSKLKTPTGISCEIIRKFHRQMINKALNALEKQSVKERYITSVTMAISKDLLPKIETLIEEHKAEVQEVLASDANCNPDSLYQLNFQLFNLKHKD